MELSERLLVTFEPAYQDQRPKLLGKPLLGHDLLKQPLPQLEPL